MWRLAEEAKSFGSAIMEGELTNLTELLQLRHMLPFISGRAKRQFAEMKQLSQCRSHIHVFTALFDAKFSELRHVGDSGPEGRNEDRT